ncbi:unnamed protein product, partial [Amoebophrya sp. A25]
GEWRILSAGSSKHAGAAWAIHQSIWHLVVDWRAVGGRICILDLRVGKGKPFRVVCVYAPTAEAKNETKTEALYAELGKAVRGVARYAIVGDFNARLPIGATQVTGPHG